MALRRKVEKGFLERGYAGVIGTLNGCLYNSYTVFCGRFPDVSGTIVRIPADLRKAALFRASIFLVPARRDNIYIVVKAEVVSLFNMFGYMDKFGMFSE